MKRRNCPKDMIFMLCFLLAFSGCRYDKESIQNKKALDNAAAANGHAYHVIRYEYGSDSASGRKPAYFVVSQDDLIYTLYAQNGQIIESDFENKKAGKAYSEEIAKKLPDIFDSRKYLFISSIDDSRGTSFEMKVVFFEEPSDDISWVYDLYSYLYETESSFSLHVILYSKKEAEVEGELENGYENMIGGIYMIQDQNVPKLTPEQFQGKKLVNPKVLEQESSE